MMLRCMSASVITLGLLLLIARAARRWIADVFIILVCAGNFGAFLIHNYKGAERFDINAAVIVYAAVLVTGVSLADEDFGWIAFSFDNYNAYIRVCLFNFRLVLHLSQHQASDE